MKRKFLFSFCTLLSFASPQPSAGVDKASLLSKRIHAVQLRIPAGAPQAGVTGTNSSTYIEAVLDDAGHFTIGTVEGDPSRSTDDNQPLLYGHPFPATSDTMVRIDGVSSSIHTGTASGASINGDALENTLTVGELQVFERLTVQDSQATGRKDTVQIYFKVTNTGAGSHTVSLRTQLDTLLGTNDGAPFRIPNVGEVTHDIEFRHNANIPTIGEIPPQALVLDNLTTPAIISLFTFSGLGFLTPDRVVFGYWPASVDQWDYTVDPNRSFLDHNGDGIISGTSPDSDSSVIVWWGYPDANAFALASGESKEFAILYGIGNCNLKGTDPFTILFCGPASLQGHVQGASYQYTPVNVTGFLTNNTAAAVAGAIATLNFTPDFQLSPGYSRTRAIEETAGAGLVSAGKTTQIDWQLTSNGRQLGERTFSLSVDANGKHVNLTRNITTLTIPNLLYGQATDENGNPIAGATITVLRGETIVGTATTQSDGTYSVQGLAPGSYTVRLSVSGKPDSSFTAVVTDGNSPGVTGNPGSFAVGSALQAFAYPNPAREGRVHITYFTGSASSVEVQIFTTSGELIRTISDGSAGAGWHAVDWSIDDVANGVYFYLVKAGSSRTRGKIAVIKRRGL